MKVERKESKEKCPTCGGPGFQPVVIELETQDEVDEMCGLLGASPYSGFGGDLFNNMTPYKSINYINVYNEYSERLIRRCELFP